MEKLTQFFIAITIYRIEGKFVEEYGFPSVEVVKMERLGFRGDERYGG